MFTIRIAQPADAAEIAHLNRLFNDWDEPPERYAERLADPRRVDTILLAEVEGQAVGIACLYIAPSVFYSFPHTDLTELYVCEPYRRQGIGRALVQAAEQLALAAGAQEMFILTDFKNLPAQALYRSLGYTHEDLALHKHFPH